MVSESGRLRSFWWDESEIHYIDQRFLPNELVSASTNSVDGVVHAIASAAVNGRRAVDGFAALGIALAQLEGQFDEAMIRAIERIRRAIGSERDHPLLDRIAAVPSERALHEALRSLSEAEAVDRAIAQNGATLLAQNSNVLTHGNTGALATGGAGTAVAVVVAAHDAGKRLHTFVSEGAPLGAGSRIVAFELQRAGVPCSVVADAAAAWIVRNADITAILVGAQAIALNGDVVGEIGTYGIALAAARHRVPLYVAAQRASIASGPQRRDFDAHDRRVDAGVHAALAFDITPGHLITAFITEYGITRPPYDESLSDLWTRPTYALLEPQPRS